MNQYDREHWNLPIDPPEEYYCECGERLKDDEDKCPACQAIEELWAEDDENRDNDYDDEC